MPDLEKAIRGLMACKKHWCAECPYAMPGMKCCGRDQMFDDAIDAIALLKAQEPRVMTWDDVLEFAELSDVGYSDKTPCYIEYFEPEPRFIKWGDAETIYKWVNVYITRDERRRLYNRKDRHGWRCWTARPSEQQMRDTPWEGDVDET